MWCSLRTDRTDKKRKNHILLPVTIIASQHCINKNTISKVAFLYHRIVYLAIDMNATSTPEFTFAEVSKNFIENSSASAFPLSNETFYISQRIMYNSRLSGRFNHISE